MLEKDHKESMVKSAVEMCKKDVTLDYDHVDKHSDFTGHKSAPYGGGPPSAAGPSSHAPGTGNSSHSY